MKHGSDEILSVFNRCSIRGHKLAPLPMRPFFLCAFMSVLASAAMAADRPQPNIILILADDMGRGDASCYDGAWVKTPHLEQMAAEGTRFEWYYSASPICSPSRTALTTGMFPARWQITSYLQTRKGNAACEQVDFLDPQAPSLARSLKTAGYATAHFGKWHQGGGRDVVDPPKFAEYGFDERASTWESPEPHPDITAKDWIWSPEDKVKRWDRTAFFVDQTLDFLKRHPEQPCYVNLWLDDPHSPWVPSDEVLAAQPAGPEQERKLRAVLIEMDRQIGRLLAGLKETGADKRTLVIFTSDNGALPTFQGRRSGGLRGSKLSLYEGGIRVPFIAWWPGKVKAGRADDQTVISAVDLFSSICSLADATLDEGYKSDGEDLSAAILGSKASRSRPMFWEYGRNEEAFKYPEGRDRSPNVAVREGQWKLLIKANGLGAELYDLAADPKETTNVAAQYPDITQRLSLAALQWRNSLP